MTPRYGDPEIERLWSEPTKVDLWTDIELAHLSELLDRDPRCHERPSVVSARAAEERVGHDVGGFLLALEEALSLDPDAQRWLHFGLTSSDLVDSANAIRVNHTTRALRRRFQAARELVDLRPEFGLAVNGRTHGQIASPTTIGHRWRAALDAVDVLPTSVEVPMMLTGAVGRSSGLWRRGHADRVASRFGYLAAERTTQVLPRAYFVRALRVWADWATACEQIALDVRLMSLTGDVSEPAQAVGSSTMPGKVNPIRAEQVCGLARTIRTDVRIVEDGQALWLDRDLSHSSADRLTFGRTATLTGYVLTQTQNLMSRLQVHPQPIEPGRSEAERVLADLVVARAEPRSVNYEYAREMLGQVEGSRTGNRNPRRGDTDRTYSKAAIGKVGQ